MVDFAVSSVPGAAPATVVPTATPPITREPMTLYVCTTCRDADHSADTPCAGARLYAAISQRPVEPGIRVVPVECLSVCKRICAVSFAAPGKWTYVYGDLPPTVPPTS